MDVDDMLAKRPDSPIARLRAEDLDPLSLDELDQRIALLEAEIARTRQKKASASAFRAVADDLFRR